MLSVKISCPVFPSEDPNKVKEAITKIFPDAEFSENDDGYECTAPSLDHFSKQIRKQKILDTTRSQMQRGLKRTGRITINLNKQVAYMGKVSFCEGKVILGTIKVVIESDEPEALIDTVAPETVDGEEVLL